MDIGTRWPGLGLDLKNGYLYRIRVPNAYEMKSKWKVARGLKKRTIRSFTALNKRGTKWRTNYTSPGDSLVAAIKRAVARRAYGDRKSLYNHYKRMKGRR